MLADLWFALRRGWDQLTYWRHTYSPISPWRRQTDEVVAIAKEEARRYGLQGVRVDRRRAYQVARMVIPNRHGDHVVDLLPDAYQVYAPTCCASTQAGKKEFAPLLERRDGFRRHPQTLAYLLTPPRLSRRGVGSSPYQGLVIIEPGEPTPDAGTLAERLRQGLGRRAPKAAVRRYAEVLAHLHAGPAEEATDEAA